MTTDATFDYGDLLDGQAGGWRSRLIWLALWHYCWLPSPLAFGSSCAAAPPPR
jgi:hypothetical protein